MRAVTEKDGPSRFERAKRSALELLEGLESGDAAAIILAGSPPRVALAATTNLDAVRATIEGAMMTDRGTDLDGAVKIAGELLDGVQHVDKRVVVLSDMADGGADAPPLKPPEGVKLWIPLEDLRGGRMDCGVVRADRSGVRVDIRVACTPGYQEGTEKEGVDAERRIEVRYGERVLAEAKLRHRHRIRSDAEDPRADRGHDHHRAVRGLDRKGRDRRKRSGADRKHRGSAVRRRGERSRDVATAHRWATDGGAGHDVARTPRSATTSVDGSGIAPRISVACPY